AFLDAVAKDVGRRLDPESCSLPLRFRRSHAADPVHMSLDVMAAQRLPGPERRLEVRFGSERLRPRERLRHNVGGEMTVVRRDDGQADPVHGDRVTDVGIEGRLDDEPASFEARYARPFSYDSCEHAPRLPLARPTRPLSPTLVLMFGPGASERRRKVSESA